MAKLEGVFDITELDDHELGHLMFVLNSPSYERIFEPYLRRVRDSFNTKLLDPSGGRKNELPDDFLRGGIAAIDGLLNLFTRLIDESEIERIARSQQELSDQQEYQKFRQQGAIKPGDYNPDEDY